MRLPDPSLVVLVGATASGKSEWAAQWFHPDQVVSSDRLRAVVGAHERDQRASKDAFEVLDLIVAKRLKRKLTTVIDTTGLEAKRRDAWRALAEKHGVPAYAVVLDTPAKVVRERNRARGSPVPAKVVTSQIAAADGIAGRLAEEGFTAVHAAAPVTLVPPSFLTAMDAAVRQREDPMTLDFGLQIPSFAFPGAPASTGTTLAEVAAAAEDAGFDSLWVMDHLLQIPFIGREWLDMMESYTTLGFLAASTSRIRLGTMVTGITYRNPAHLGKIVATLDVLSGGRAMCGLGAAWFEREHAAVRLVVPAAEDRYEMLEDALQLLPLLWGTGSPSFEGRTIPVPEAIVLPAAVAGPRPDPGRRAGGAAHAAPRGPVCGRVQPVRERGRRAPQARGPAPALQRRGPRPRRHPRHPPRRGACHRRRRTARGSGRRDRRGARRSAARLAEAGVQTAIVGLADTSGPEAVSRFADVIAAFRPA